MPRTPALLAIPLAIALTAQPVVARRAPTSPLPAIQAFYECFNSPHYGPEYEGARVSRHPPGLTQSGEEPGLERTNAPPMHRFAIPRGLTLFGLHPTILRLTEAPSASFAQSRPEVVRAIHARFPQARAEPLAPDGTSFTWRGHRLDVTDHVVFTNLQNGEPRREPGTDVLCIS